ncbi:hypothetical protein SLEP1_g7399 [Rubroshorea leprosula]|uniref:BZIP domain-containing protein n=1 Tax=Rubroshorea leprosula TaxID=152421 RepID=A0AAV5I7A8_9ROSI|nr:hypothetical protein SLEP1_g7399 [Rubroshorea leprosula]
MGHVMASSQQNMNLVAPLQNRNVSMDASFGMGNVLGMGFQGNNFTTNGYAVTYQVFRWSKKFFGESFSNVENGNRAQFLVESSAMQNKKMIIDGPPKVVVERRQRRMIKNRESAARSQARKQVLQRYEFFPNNVITTWLNDY